MNEMPSLLPALAVIIPAAAAVLIWLFGRFASRLNEALALVGSVGALACSVGIGKAALEGQVLLSFGKQFYADALSALLVVLVSAVGFLAVLYSLRYMRHQVQEGGLTHTTTEGRLTAFYGWLMLFVSTMLWACLSNNIIMLYVAVEASTIASGLLVAFYWDKRALEAGYKYLMLLTVGITFALFGCVLVYAAGASVLGGSKGLLISELKAVASGFPITTVVLASAFLIVGFGTKAGVAPFHPWLPDAHAEAPTPVSALLSGVMLKIAIYAMVRTVTLFYPDFPPVAAFVLGLGVFTLILGDLMALAQNDLKRMLAYSSVSQMGYILMGAGCLAFLGAEGSMGMGGFLYHVINHAFFKGCFFLAAGSLLFRAHQLDMYKLGGLWRRMPVTCLCWCLAALGIMGIPLFNGFVSKTLLHHAVVESHHLAAESHLWAAGWIKLAEILFIVTSGGTIAYITKTTYYVFFAKPSDDSHHGGEVREAPGWMLAGTALLAAGVLFNGLLPGVVLRKLVAPVLSAVPGLDHHGVEHLAEMKIFVWANLKEVLVPVLIGAALFLLGARKDLFRLKKARFQPFHLRLPAWLGVDYWYMRGARGALGLLWAAHGAYGPLKDAWARWIKEAALGAARFVRVDLKRALWYRPMETVGGGARSVYHAIRWELTPLLQEYRGDIAMGALAIAVSVTLFLIMKLL